MEALERLGGESWFRLGDRDLATHLYRSQRLAEGAPLSEVHGEITAALGIGARLLPMSDDPVRTRLTLVDGARDRLSGLLRPPSACRGRGLGPLRGRRRGPARPPES